MDKKSSLSNIYRCINLTEYNKAIALIEKEIKFSGPKEDLLMLLGDMERKISNDMGAAETYQKIITLYPKNTVAVYKFIETCIDLKRFETARRYLENLNINGDDSWEYYYLEGKFFYALNEKNKAAANLKEALKRNPKNIDILILIGEISQQIGLIDDALRYYLALLKIDNNNAKAYENLGLLYYKSNNKKKAYQLFKKANSIKPNNPQILKMMGLIDLESGNYRSSIKYLEHAVKLDPKGVDNLVFLGFNYEKLEKFDQAENTYLKAISLTRENPEPFIHLANLYSTQNSHDKAFQILSEADKKFPENEKILFNLGKNAIDSENYENAKHYFQKVLNLNSESIDAIYGLGLANEMLGNYDLAQTYYDSILQKDPDNLLTLLREGTLHIAKGERVKATYYLQKLLQLDPSNIRANILLGQLYLDENKYSDGIVLLENAKKLDPSNREPYLILGEYFKKHNQLQDAVEQYNVLLDFKKFASLDSIEQFNEALANYEDILCNYSNEIKARNIAVLSKFKERNIKEQTAESLNKSIQESIGKLFDNVDSSIGTSIDEIEDSDSEYELISKILTGQFQEDTGSDNKDKDSSKILDYLTDGIFSPEEIQEKAETIITPKKKEEDGENNEDKKSSSLLSEDESMSDILQRLTIDSLRENLSARTNENKHLPDDEDLTLLDRNHKRDSIPYDLEDAYKLNESERKKEQSLPEYSQNQQQPVINYSMPAPSSQPQVISIPIPQTVQQPYMPSNQQPQTPQTNVQTPTPQSYEPQSFPGWNIPPSSSRPYIPPVSKQGYIPEDYVSPSGSSPYRPLSESLPNKPSIAEKAGNPEQMVYDQSDYPQNIQYPHETNYPENSEEINKIPESKKQGEPFYPANTANEKKGKEESFDDNQEPENYQNEFDTIPSFPDELLSESKNDNTNPEEFEAEHGDNAKDKFENELGIPEDFSEPIETLPIEELFNKNDLEATILPDEKIGDNRKDNNEQNFLHIGDVSFGPPKPEVIKELLNSNPKNEKETVEYLKKSISEIGKYFYTELKAMPKDIQEKATLSSRFQKFISFMRKEAK
jgi:tetratricopeptide (TPR) repeat protein